MANAHGLYVETRREDVTLLTKEWRPGDNTVKHVSNKYVTPVLIGCCYLSLRTIGGLSRTRCRRFPGYVLQ